MAERARWPAGVMLARPVADLPAANSLHGGCLYEPKFDGVRLLIGVHQRGASLRSRHGTDLTAAFPEIASAASAQLPSGTLLDGELVVGRAERLDFAALQRRLLATSRAAVLARTAPASFIAFDLLAYDGAKYTDRPLRERRRALEGLLPSLSPPLQVTPATRDREAAAVWLREYTGTDVGVEGLVIKGLAARYTPGRRGWLKLKTRTTAEAVVGAVTGTLESPHRLILALPDAAGRLHVAGGTTPLDAVAWQAVAALLRRPREPHPWPSLLPAGRTGALGGPPTLQVTLVQPELVVEVEADTAFEHARWRHMTRFHRIRAELSLADVKRVEP